MNVTYEEIEVVSKWENRTLSSLFKSIHTITPTRGPYQHRNSKVYGNLIRKELMCLSFRDSSTMN